MFQRIESCLQALNGETNILFVVLLPDLQWVLKCIQNLKKQGIIEFALREATKAATNVLCDKIQAATKIALVLLIKLEKDGCPVTEENIARIMKETEFEQLLINFQTADKEIVIRRTKHIWSEFARKYPTAEQRTSEELNNFREDQLSLIKEIEKKLGS